MYDVAVIGCGVVGSLIARELTKYDVKVCMLEKENDVAMGASKANSGIVHAGFDAKPGSLKAKLNVEGCRMMPSICKNLGVKYKNNGSIVIGFDDDDMKHIAELYDRGTSNGVKNMEILDKNALHELEPNLSDNVKGALYAKDAGIVCPYGLNIAAAGNAMDNGAELMLNFEVVSISQECGVYIISSKNGDFVTAKYIINSAGLYSDKIAKMVGDTTLSVHPRIGEYMILDKDSANLCSRTIFRTPSKMGKGILISPTVDGNIILGPTSVDRTDKEDKATSPEGLSLITSQTLGNIPSAPLRNVITSFAGLRSVGNTGDFIIKKSADNFVTLSGIESPGLTASPAIAKYVVRLLQKQFGLTTKKNENFCGKRKAYYKFSEMTPAQKNKIISENPDFGTIICRCEGISKGEIIEALTVNPAASDIDGVKRRTRSGMGRCQGGFCSTAIVEIISSLKNIPYENVTKFGKNSYINFERTK